MALTLGLSLGIGVLLGLLGGGGSILTVPMLVYVLGIEPKTAIPASFVVVGVSSLMAIIQHARMHHVCWKSGFFFGLAGMAGAYGGGRLAACFSGEVLMAMFGMVTLATGLAMLLRPKPAGSSNPPMGNALPLCPAQVPYLKLLFDGFLVGLLTGLVGVGGGFLIVPALTLWVGLPMPAAVGTSLLVIVMNALAGLGGYAAHAGLDWRLTATVTGAAVAGAIFGGMLSTRIGAAMLRRMFGLFVLMVAAYVLSQALTKSLLANLGHLLKQHIEFVLGIASLVAVLMLYRLGVWIHAQGQHAPAPLKNPGK